jgi:hypothetical protein
MLPVPVAYIPESHAPVAHNAPRIVAAQGLKISPR